MGTADRGAYVPAVMDILPAGAAGHMAGGN